jgi:hypothetical protein
MAMPRSWWPKDAPYPQQPLHHLVTFELCACIAFADDALQDDGPGQSERASYVEWHKALISERGNRAAERAEFTAQCKARYG